MDLFHYHSQEEEISQEEENGIFLSISDLMSGIFLFFLLLFITVLLQLKESELEKQRLLDQVKEQRRIIIGTLINELQGNNINVTVNPETGDISIRENILFDLASAELKPEGRQFLRQFIPVYSGVVFTNPTIESEVSRVVIEGHTSSSGDYKSNLELSLLRSLSVSQYIFSQDFDFPTKEEFSQKVLLSGRGEIDSRQDIDDPVDRKVVFRFQFRTDQLEQSIEEL